MREIPSLLRNVLKLNYILQSLPASFSALISSLKDSEPEHLDTQLSFLDNCICRGAKKPVHYADLVRALQLAHPGGTGKISPLVAIITEQWPFVIKAGDAAAEKAVGTWIARLMGNLKQAGENSKTLKAARDHLCEAAKDKKTKSALKKSLKVSEEDRGELEDVAPTKPADSGKTATVQLEELFGALSTEGKTHNALHRWEREELEVSIEQGHIAELMLCLCSEHEEVRRQAYNNLSRFMAKLRVS